MLASSTLVSHPKGELRSLPKMLIVMSDRLKVGVVAAIAIQGSLRDDW
ncbi:MAG: hypothetical protein SFY66_10425 [Oculatellaceae cyanobacterium bins.114]|nr:hypothetical protein [Oculatellaceae cyanobacterium bins.114]